MVKGQPEGNDEKRGGAGLHLKKDVGNRSVAKLPPLIRNIGFFALLLFAFSPVISEAAEVRLVPKIGLYGGYDDNILFERGDKLESFVYDIQPKFEVNYATLLSTVNLRAIWDILRYVDESELNRVNQDYFINGTYKIGQRWNTWADFRYIDDTTLNSYLEEVGRVVERVGRDYYDAKAGVSYSLTTVSYIDGQYRYEKARYEDNIFPNYSRHEVYLYYKHLLKTGQDALSVGPSFYHRVNDLNTVDSVSLDLGWERDWSEITNTYASIGARYTDQEDKSGATDDGWGALGRFNLTRLGTVSTIKFEYYHDLATPVDGNELNVDNFYLLYNYLITERFGLGVDSRLIFSYDLFDDNEGNDNSRYFEITPFISYRITATLSSSLRYRYQQGSQNLFDNEDVRKKRSVWLEIQYEYPMMF